MSLPARLTPVRLVAGAGAALVAAALAGCAPADSGSSSSSSTTAAAGASASASPSATCSKDQLKTRAAGKLTVATDKPVFEPWFKDDKPESGQGFESAVAYAVADKLGYAKGDVTWTRASFDSVTQPGPKPFDFDINEVSITDKRKQAVDFSSGYYDVTQAIITTKGSKIANAKGIADLKNAKIGAQVGTTSLDTIKNVIKPSGDPAVFNTNDDAVKALGNGQIDGLVVDLPTAFYITGSGQVKDSSIVGQFANAGGTPEQFGLVLDKGSSLTSCVSQAVDALRSDGTLTKLEQQWLSQSAGAPVLS
ncbi:MAG: amino acid ABC transporter substrate-binding protein [Pseudonocardiales bacterium]|nr:amino acid ABC transporter substrate-binding protein [Pseudonocardiales bacterium]